MILNAIMFVLGLCPRQSRSEAGTPLAGGGPARCLTRRCRRRVARFKDTNEDIDAQAILVSGTREAAGGLMRAAYLPRLVRGAFVGAFATSEPGASTDLSVGSIETIASPVKGGWRVDGTKRWITDPVAADGQDGSVLAAMAKIKGSALAVDVAREAIQARGGYGFVRHLTGPGEDWPLKAIYRDAKIGEIYQRQRGAEVDRCAAPVRPRDHGMTHLRTAPERKRHALP